MRRFRAPVSDRSTCTIKNDPKDLQIVDFKLANMDVHSTKSRVLGAMAFGVGAPELLVRRVDLRADPVDFDLLRTLAGKPFTQDWQGQLSGMVKGRGGPLTHFQVDESRGVFNDAHVPGAVSRFTGKGELDIFNPAFTAFHGFYVDVGSLDLRTIEYLFPAFPRLHGTVSGTATLDSSWLDVRFSNARLAHQDGEGEPSRVTGSGRITDGEPFVAYDVVLNAEPLSLTMLARSYPNPMRGLVSGPIRARGTAPDLETAFSLQGSAGAISFDGRLDLDSVGGIGGRGRGEFSALSPGALLENTKIPIGVFSGHYAIDITGETVSSLRGTADADIERTTFDSVRIYPSFAHLRFGEGRMSIVDSLFLRTAAGTLVATGGIGLPKGQPDSLRYDLALDSLGGLRRYISHPDTSRLGAAATPPDSLSGTLSLRGRAWGTFDSLTTTGRLLGTKLYFNREQGDALTARFNVTATPATVSGAIAARVDTVTVLGVALDTIGAVIRIDDATHAAFTAGAQSHNGPTALAAGTWASEATKTRQVRLDPLGLSVGSDMWHLAAPATIAMDSAGGVRLDSLVLHNRDSAVVTVVASIPNVGAAEARLAASRIPLKDFGVLAQFADSVTGIGDVTAQATGTKMNPRLVASASLSSLKWRGVDIDRVASDAQYHDARLNATLDVVRKGTTAVSAGASLPIELTLPLTTRWHNDTIGGFLRADSTDLSFLQLLLGSSVTQASGRLSANVLASGTQRAPVLSGSASVSGGSANLRSIGVTLSDVNAYLVGGRDANGRDSIRVDSIVATTREKNLPVGHVKVTGWLKDLAGGSDPTFALAMGADMFHAYYRRSVAELFVSTPRAEDSLRLRGSVQSSALTGALRVDRGSIFLADPDIARKQSVQFQFGEDTSSAGSSRPVSATVQTFMTNLQIQTVPVTLGNDVRLRSKDANVKLGGELRLETSTSRSTRTLAENGELVPRLGLVGTLRTESGTYNLNLGPVQREFQVLPGGTVTFDGPPEDPVLDINAKFDVKQVHDLSVIVNLNGRLLPYPVIDFKSTADYQISTSDLLSYLLTGSPGFDFGANAGTSQILSSLLAPTLSAIAANALRPSLGSWVDVLQLNLVTSQTTTSSFSQYLSGLDHRCREGVWQRVSEHRYGFLPVLEYARTELQSAHRRRRQGGVPLRSEAVAQAGLRSADRQPQLLAAAAHWSRPDAAQLQSVAVARVALLIRRVVVIANPASRRGRHLAERARRTFAKRSIECDLVFTERAGHAAELSLHHAPNYDAVFVLGGDGTVMEVAGALAGSETPIGVLAGGTGNLLARALGIPLGMRQAVPSLLDGAVQEIDLGRFESGRRFAIAAGVGIDASMVSETPVWLKQRLGIAAYALVATRAALRAVLRGEYFEARVTIDGTTHVRQAAAVMIANFGAVLGDRLTLGPNIRTDDGMLDACVFSPRTVADALRIMWRLIRADFRSDPCMLYSAGRTARVDTTPSLPWQADGELMGMTPFTVVVEPRAARLLVPKREAVA